MVVGEEVEQVDVFVGDVSHPPPASLAAEAWGVRRAVAQVQGTLAERPRKFKIQTCYPDHHTIYF